MSSDFDPLPPGLESHQAPGKDSNGFTNPDDGISVQPGQVMHASLSLSAASPRGIISFDIQRKATRVPQGYRSVFALKDADDRDILLFQLNWISHFDPRFPAVRLRSAEYFMKGMGLWSPWIQLDREVLPGQWVHLDMTWDDELKRYGLFVDGRPVDATPRYFDNARKQVLPDPRIQQNKYMEEKGLPPLYTSMPFGDMLSRAAMVRFGINYTEGNLNATTPLSNAVLDSFTVQVAPFDLITSVTHDAFSVAGYSGKLVAGDTFTVTLTAEPGGQAAFAIIQPTTVSGGITTPEKVRVPGVPMAEDPGNPGYYVGTYTVNWGDLAAGGQVVGRFTDRLGFDALPLAASRSIDIDGTTHMTVNASSDLVPADETARSGLTVVAADANGKAVKDHQLKLTMSTTDEYTGTVGGGTFEDLVGGSLDVDWGGMTDSFGEVTAQYKSGFAAKTILVSAKDMVSGDVGVGFVRSYIDGEVSILVTEPVARALSVAGFMEVSLSRDWLTADGKSRSRITAVVKDADGNAVSGHSVQFTLLGDNGSIRVVQGKTDSRGHAIADYIAGTLMGQVQVEVRDLTSGMTAVVSIELRPDAPAEIELVADPGEVVTGGQSTVSAKVTDANGNPNNDVDVLYSIISGSGSVKSPSVATDKDGVAQAAFIAGDIPGLVTVRGTVISRVPTAEEISAAKGAVFLFGLEEDSGRLDVIEWLVKVGGEVVEGQELVILEDRADVAYTIVAPRDGVVSTFTAEERDRVEYGDTLGYILEVAE